MISYLEKNLIFLSYAAPSAPVGVVATNLSSTSLSVVWGPPDLPRGIITLYTISYYLTSIGEGSSNSLDTTGTSGVLNGLMKYTEYSVYVQARTVAGIGDQSETVTVSTDEDSECNTQH